MATRSRPNSKIVVKGAAGTFLDVKIVHNYVGEGKKRRVESSDYGIFHYKHRVTKDSFNKPELAISFIKENIGKYDKKTKKFK